MLANVWAAIKTLFADRCELLISRLSLQRFLTFYINNWWMVAVCNIYNCNYTYSSNFVHLFVDKTFNDDQILTGGFSKGCEVIDYFL